MTFMTFFNNFHDFFMTFVSLLIVLQLGGMSIKLVLLQNYYPITILQWQKQLQIKSHN